MKRTFREWFETMVEPYRTNAINNTEEHLQGRLDKSMFESIASALANGFSWFNFREQCNWAEIKRDLEKDPNDPKYIKLKNQVVNTYELW